MRKDSQTWDVTIGGERQTGRQIETETEKVCIRPG